MAMEEGKHELRREFIHSNITDELRWQYHVIHVSKELCCVQNIKCEITEKTKFNEK